MPRIYFIVSWKTMYLLNFFLEFRLFPLFFFGILCTYFIISWNAAYLLYFFLEFRLFT